MFYDILSNPASRERLRAFSVINQPSWPRLPPCKRRAMVDSLSSLRRRGLSGCLGTPHVIGTIGGGDFEA